MICKTNISLITMTCAALTSCPSTLVVGAAHADAAPHRVLTTLPSSSAKLAVDGDERHDFGAISGLSAVPVTHTYVLRNDTGTPLTVTTLHPSCGCTSALLDGNARLPFVLTLGQSLSVRVSVDPLQLTPGPLDKSVAVSVRGQDEPAATLHLVGTVLPVATFSPVVLDFGKVIAGEERTLPLAVQVNTRLLPSGQRPRLVSSDPDVQITPAASPAGNSSSTEAQSYRVTLAPGAHLGPLAGKVSLVFTDGQPGASELPGGSAWVRGEVVGDVSASPSAVAFGTVPSGRSTTQRVFLIGRDLQALTLSCDSPFLSVRLSVSSASASGTAGKAFGTGPFGTPPTVAQGATPDKPSQMATLEVTLNPKAPPQALESHVRVTTPDGQQLVLPVYAFVVKPDAPSQAGKGEATR